MRRLSALALGLLVAGCFSPKYKAFLQCSGQNTCPPGQGCNPQHICQPNYVPPVDSGMPGKDASSDVSDGPHSEVMTDAMPEATPDAPADGMPDAAPTDADASTDVATDARDASGTAGTGGSGGAAGTGGSGGTGGAAGTGGAGGTAGIPNPPGGLIGHWALGDEHGDGETVPDLATADGAQNGTIYDNGGYLQTIKDHNNNPNKALFFSADDYVSDQYTYIKVPGITALPASVTITAWIAQQPGNQLGVIAGINHGPQLYQDEYHVTLRMPTSSSEYGRAQGPTLSTGTWVFVAGVVQPSGPASWKLDLYVNGALYMSTTIANGTVAAAGNFVIGGMYNCSGIGCNDGFKGDIDDVRLYNRALSASDVMAVYLNP